MNPSISGNFLAKEVLKTIQNRTTAITSSVPCHACGVYEGLLRVTKPWMIVPATNESPTTAPCQPMASSHPVDALEFAQICFTRNHTRDVAQVLLAGGRSKFGHPVVLTTSRRGPDWFISNWRCRASAHPHGSHFRDAQVDENAGNDRHSESPE